MLSKVATAALALAIQLHAQVGTHSTTKPATKPVATPLATTTTIEPPAPPLLEIKAIVPEQVKPGDSMTVYASGSINVPRKAFFKPTTTTVDRNAMLAITIAGVPAEVTEIKDKLVVVTVPKVTNYGRQPVAMIYNSTPLPKSGVFVLKPDVSPLVNSTGHPVEPTKTVKPITPETDWKVIFIGAITLSLVTYTFVMGYLGNRRNRALEEQLQQQSYQFSNLKSRLNEPEPAEANEPEVELPPLPRELVNACASGECVLFAGQGIDLVGGYRSWTEILASFIEQTHADRGDLLDGLNAGNTDAVVDILMASRETRPALVNATATAYRRPPSSINDALVKLAGVPFTAVITTSWSPLLGTLFNKREPVEAIISEANESPDLLTGQRFAVVRLFGSAEKPDSLVLTRTELRQQLSHNALYAKYLTSLLAAKTHLFFGVSISTMDEYLSALQWVRSSRPHYAVLESDRTLRLERERLRARYGVEVIEVPRMDKWGGSSLFAERLADDVKPTVRSQSARQDDVTLRKVSLKNIGPFSKLDVKLNEGWTVLLGNNASGKSSILRAIAAALAGDDSRAAIGAERLLKSGESRGSVELTIGKEIYRADLVRELSRVRVVCRQLTPLQTGRVLALGFPAMRGGAASSGGPSDRSGSLPSEALPNPDVADVLPLVSGDSDTRLDSLKQWLINVEARRLRKMTASSSEAAASRDLRDKFFIILNKLTPGLECSLDRVDFDTWQVYVKTADGTVPIDHVSQGMISVISWVGTLLQRLYSVRSSSPDPSNEPAIVLIDEIDAHLHPKWQQEIVGLLKGTFKKVQFIATTHSPLIVAGLRREEVQIARRSFDQSAIIVEPSPVHFEGLRADQILTSPLFDLDNTRGHIARYQELMSKKVHTPEEEGELSVLRQGLGSSAQTPDERKAETDWKETLNKLTSQDAFAAMLSGDKVDEEAKDKLIRALGKPPETM